MTIINEPQFWRMQLHPKCETPEEKKECTDMCLAQCRIGLDFEIQDLGSLQDVAPSALGSEKGYYGFYSRMAIGDFVLITIGDMPYALVKVAGDYEYSADPNSAGIWCRHHRKVDAPAYYADYEDRLPKDKFPSTKAIQPVDDQAGKVYKFVDAWVVLIT